MKIITYPNPILTTPARHIAIDTSCAKRLNQLAKEMIKIMYEHEGVGLAAPQVGESLRLCVIRKDKSKRYEYETGLEEDLILINPTTIERSVNTWLFEEGCLSIPGVIVPVRRAHTIRVRAEDIHGDTYEFNAEHFFARVIQHEIDHLDGVLIIDKRDNQEAPPNQPPKKVWI